MLKYNIQAKFEWILNVKNAKFSTKDLGSLNEGLPIKMARKKFHGK